MISMAVRYALSHVFNATLVSLLSLLPSLITHGSNGREVCLRLRSLFLLLSSLRLLAHLFSVLIYLLFLSVF
jgi:hypothetical protein